MLNHRPEQTGIWFDYNGWRYKDWYDIRLKSGHVVESCRPNANAWFGKGGAIIPDSQVAQVRLKPDLELPKWALTGQGRIQRNLELFGDDVPAEACPEPAP